MDLSTFRVEQKKLNDSIQRHGKQAIADAFKSFFDKFPNVEAVRWTQYTPHFNDGDECVFDRHSFDLKGEFTEELISAEHTDDDGFYDCWDVNKKTELGKAARALNESFDDTNDVFKVAFGDGVRVTATRKGFTVEDYDHD